MLNGTIHCKWRFLAGKIICKWAIFHSKLLNNQRTVNPLNFINLGISDLGCHLVYSIGHLLVITGYFYGMRNIL